MKIKGHLQTRKLIIPGVVLLAFCGLGLWGWLASSYIQPLILFGYIGISLGVGLGLYEILPKAKKPVGRRLTLFLVGAFLIFIAMFMSRENVQLEGAIFGLLTGVIEMGVIHYLIAKVVGPLLFGRMWCGWACWTVMILDLLPFKRPAGRLPRRIGWIRYLHFGLSVVIVLLLIYAVGFREGAKGSIAVAWFIAGNLLYYAVGILLAYTLKDNRAFCKYVCPISVPLKLMSRFSLIKISGDAAKCNDCRACVRMCPMDIRVPEYILNHERVLSTECSLCQTCITLCAPEALKLSFGLDVGGKEFMRPRGQAL